MSNNSIVEHRGNYYFVALREEYLIICAQSSYKKQVKDGGKSRASTHCKAFILDILEHWTNTKRDKGEKLAITMTYQQWSDAMYGMFGRNTIIDSLDELIGEGLVSKGPCKIPGNKDTYQYRFNYQELNKRIRQLPERSPNDTHPKWDASQMKPDASQMKRVTHPKWDADPSQKGCFIDTSTDTNNIDSTERKSDAPTQNLNVSTSEGSSHSFAQSSSSFSLSEEGTKETKPEVAISEDVQRILDFAKKDFFKHRKPELTEKLIGECEELSKVIQTQEQFNSLAALVRAKFSGTIHIKNLVNALNDWGQIQEDSQPAEIFSARVSPEAKERNMARMKQAVELKPVEDHDIIKKVKSSCESFLYSDVDTCIQRVFAMKQQFNVDNETLDGCMIDAHRNSYRAGTMLAYFTQLEHLLASESTALAG